MVEHQTPEFSWVLPTPRYSWVGGVSLVRNWDNHGVWICQCAVWLFNGCKTYLVNMNTLIALTPFISASGHHLRPPIRSSSANKKKTWVVSCYDWTFLPQWSSILWQHSFLYCHEDKPKVKQNTFHPENFYKSGPPSCEGAVCAFSYPHQLKVWVLAPKVLGNHFDLWLFHQLLQKCHGKCCESSNSLVKSSIKHPQFKECWIKHLRILEIEIL